jgi:hypothetical protein
MTRSVYLMSTWDIVQNIMVQQPSVYQAIFVEGMRSEQKYQERVRGQEKAMARAGKETLRKKGYIPFP